MTDELWERIRQLERSNRLWRRLAVSLMAALALLVLVAGTLGVLSVAAGPVGLARWAG
jgi:hypothetical protein